MRKNKGITLIALIITIVIMLILVAVSVNVLINSNIIGQAEKAAEGYKTAYEQEQTRIDELMEEWNRLEQDQESGCVHNWGEWQTVTPATCTIVGSQKRTCSLCNTSETQNVPVLEHNYSDATCTEPQTCTRCGATTGTALGHNLVNGVCTRCGVNVMTASDVANKPSIYGSTVTNYNANEIEWKVFYATTDRIYLIASDYVHYSKLTNAYKNGASCYNTGTHPYSYYWASSGPTSLEATGRQDGIFMATGYTLKSSNTNSRCVSGLLNTNNWKDFVDTNYADYAIGGPTLNMYIASWNAKGYTTLYTNTNTDGYYVGTSANPTDYSADMSSDTAGYGDTLYYPHQSSYSNCSGYWLAAPSDNENYHLMSVYYYGTVDNFSFLNNDFGVRPLVSLKSGVTLQENSDGTVTLIK